MLAKTLSRLTIYRLRRLEVSRELVIPMGRPDGHPIGAGGTALVVYLLRAPERLFTAVVMGKACLGISLCGEAFCQASYLCLVAVCIGDVSDDRTLPTDCQPSSLFIGHKQTLPALPPAGTMLVDFDDKINGFGKPNNSVVRECDVRWNALEPSVLSCVQ